MKTFGTLSAAFALLVTLLAGCGSAGGDGGVSDAKEWQTRDVRTSVNMDSYCKRKFGQQFSAANLGQGNWVCQTDPHNTRPISVVEACTWQQNTNRVVFDQAALAWYCLVPQQVWVPVRVGVNMDAYCKRQYGQSFSSRVIGSTVGDWVCQGSNPNDRRPINVRQACIWQQNTNVVGYTNVNDPLSWYCEK
jgi:hypothetical protein